MLVYWRKCRWITGTQLEDLFHEAKNSNTNKHQKYVSRWGPGAFASPDSQLSLHSWPLAQAVMWETSLRTQWCSVHALGPWLSSFQTISDRWGKRQKYLHPSTATCSFCDILPPLQFLACRQQHATPKITHSNMFVHLAFPPPRKKLKWPGEKKLRIHLAWLTPPRTWSKSRALRAQFVFCKVMCRTAIVVQSFDVLQKSK